MRLLLDTNIIIWAAANALPKTAVPYLADERNDLYFSAASIWEMAIKQSKGGDILGIDPSEVYLELLKNGYEELTINSRHTLASSLLPPIHRDPFDRIIIAQALTESFSIITSDERFTEYPGSTILIKK